MCAREIEICDSASMDRRLYKCAVDGDTYALLELIREDELILARVLVDCEDTPLHIAAMLGHVDFARLVLQLNPWLVKAIDKDGRSPLHFASAREHTEIANEILKVDASLCFLKDKYGRNPLHVAAVKGFRQVTEEILAANPRCLQEVTAQGETVLHLTVRNNRLELLKYFLGREDIRSLANKRDDHGDTMLDLASFHNNSQIMKALLPYQNVLEVGSCISPADGTPRRPKDMDTQYSHVSSSEGVGDRSATNYPKKMVKQYFEEQNENKLSEKRGAMMIVSVLIATLTYQAALNPPGGFWQDNKDGLAEDSGTTLPSIHLAGTAVNEKNSLMWPFVIANTVGLFASLVIILLLTSAFTIRRPTMMWMLMIIMWVSVFSVALSFSYGLQMVVRWHCLAYETVFSFSFTGLIALLLITHVVMCLRKLFRWISKNCHTVHEAV